MFQSDTKLVKDTNIFINQNLQFISNLLSQNKKLVHGNQVIELNDTEYDLLKQIDAQSLYETLNTPKWKGHLGASEELFKNDGFGINPMK